MEIKRYFGSNMNEVMAKIREECGTDAVILSTRTVRNKGFQGIFAKPMTEVMVAYEGSGMVSRGGGKLVGAKTPPAETGKKGGRQAKHSLFTPREEAPKKVPLKEGQIKQAAAISAADSVVTKPRFEVLTSNALEPGLSARTRGNAAPAPSTPAKPVPQQVVAMKREDARAHLLKNDTTLMPERLVAKPSAPKLPPSVAAPKAAPKSAQAPQDDELVGKVDALARMVDQLTKKIDQPIASMRDARERPAPIPRTETAPPRGGTAAPPDLADSVEALRLADQEVEGELAARLLSEAQASRAQDETLEESLYRSIVKFVGKPEPIRRNEKRNQTVIMLIGPTGVGKTTSLVKLAAQYVVHEDLRVGLINADTYRVGAKEQIANYAEILEIPLSVVYSVDGLIGAMRAQADRDILFIDTAGKKPSDERHKLEIQQIIDTCAPDEIFLVVSASTGNRAIREIIRNYSFITKYKIIVTKLDEISSAGAVLNAGFYSGMPIAYLAGGQRVPEDIMMADSERIANFLLGRSLTW